MDNELGSIEVSTVVDSTAELVKDLHKPQILEIAANGRNPAVTVIATPKGPGGGFDLTSTTEFSDAELERPKRRVGDAILRTLASFTDHVDRFKCEESALFALPQRQGAELSLRAIYDYHERCNAGEESFPDAQADWMMHSARYFFPFSEEWKAWQKVDGQPMEMIDFAEFLEDRLLDVMEVPDFFGEGAGPNDAKDRELVETVGKIEGRLCGSRKLLELSRGLKVHENSVVEQANTLSSGEGTIRFQVEHQDGEGKPLLVPSCFLIAIPVFDGGDLYRLLVRLRYRSRGGKIIWFMQIYRAQKALDNAFTEACEAAAKKTGLPLFYGSAESV